MKIKTIKAVIAALSLLIAASFFVPLVSTHYATVVLDGEALHINNNVANNIQNATTNAEGNLPTMNILGEQTQLTTEIIESVHVVVEHLSPLQIATQAHFPFESTYPVVFLLLVFPIVVLALVFTKLPFKRLMLPAFVGILAMTAFNVHFGVDFHANSGTAVLFWPLAITYAILLFVIFLGILANKEIPPIENVIPNYTATQRTVIIGIMLGFSLVISLVASITIPIGGVPMVRISFAGIFHNVVAILFGPFFGGVQRAAADLLVHFIRPLGAYLWPITVVAFLRGFTIGWLWLKVRNVPPKVYSIAYTAVFGLFFVFGMVNLIAVNIFPDSAYTAIITPNLPNPDNTFIIPHITSIGFMGAGIIGLVPQLVIYLVTKKSGNTAFYSRFIKLMVAIVVPGLFFNWLNTVILVFTVIGPATRAAGFMYFWLPRFFEELTTGLIVTYAFTMLMEVYELAMKRKLVQNMG
ncbi:MAG: ECF transporter S component [Defluviitaleaceae bacterium]|nr:ECF transporter S component [Defluviitaleaceae bacterium]